MHPSAHNCRGLTAKSKEFQESQQSCGEREKSKKEGLGWMPKKREGREDNRRGEEGREEEIAIVAVLCSSQKAAQLIPEAFIRSLVSISSRLLVLVCVREPSFSLPLV